MNPPGASDAPALADPTAEWRAWWPEWEIARLFLPASQRASAAAWGGLLRALTDPGQGRADATVVRAKRAWWQSELQGWSAGRYRHPLGAALQALPAPWQALADALPDPPDAPTPAFAAAVAQIEAAVFEGSRSDAVVRTILGDLHIARVLRCGDGAMVEIDRAAIAPDAARLRRLWSTLLRTRLARLRQGGVGPPPPLSVLLGSWRSARG